MKTQARQFLTVCFLSGVLFSIPAAVQAQVTKPIRSLPIPEARVNGPAEDAQGNVWLRWSSDQQLGFIQGLLEGTYWGHFKACLAAQSAAPKVRDLEQKCIQNIPAAKLPSAHYVEMVNEFYTKYPEDRALPIRRLLLKLLEPGTTIDGVHAWLDELIESTSEHDPARKHR